MQRDRKPTLAVLSYHSWETDVEQLRTDIAGLRCAGWVPVSANNALAMIEGDRAPGAKCVLVTTDDGHVEDEDWAGALRELGCPAVTFVCAALVPPARRAFYQRLAASDDFAVEDHGLRHDRHISSSRVRGYVADPTLDSARTTLSLPRGSPLLATASEVAFRRFDPDPEAIRLLTAAGACASAEEIRSTHWQAAAESELLRRGLAVRRFGNLFLRGRFETAAEYERRVADYLRTGRHAFQENFGRAPRLHAYTWWAGNATTDAVLRSLGYLGSFRGTGELQGADGRTFAIPRIPIRGADTRPLDLGVFPLRARIPRLTLAPLRVAAKRVLGID